VFIVASLFSQRDFTGERLRVKVKYPLSGYKLRSVCDLFDDFFYGVDGLK